MRRGKTHQHKEVVDGGEKVDEGGAMTRLHSPITSACNTDDDDDDDDG